MLRFVTKRFLRGILTLWVVCTLVYFDLRLQGDPVILLIGTEASLEAHEAMTSKLGLDRSPPEQYFAYLSLAARGDVGDSIRERRPATQAVFDRLGATAQLAAAALLLSVFVGVPLGVLVARYHNRLGDRGLMGFGFLGQFAPGFFAGTMA